MTTPPDPAGKDGDSADPLRQQLGANDPPRYDRPHDPWRCGLEGAACSAGPTPRGACPAVGECVPIRDGERWVCNRSPLRGGPCDHESPGGGPTPDGQCCLVRSCRPKRSWRLLRRRGLRVAAAFTVGGLLMLLGARERNDLLAPGPLTSHHAQVIARADWSNRCATCHPGGNGTWGDWLADAWSGTGAAHAAGPTGVTQTELCLACHQDLATGDAAPTLAHGLPPGALEGVRSANTLRGEGPPAIEASLLQASTLRPITGRPALGAHEGDPLACAACHQEHHGADHDLSALTDARCQACHAEQYASFAEGHPDFGLWPTTRRTRIAFSHASHGERHFAQAGRDFDCRSCHLQDATGDLTARPAYADACASCHDANLKHSFGDGIGLVALPTIDRETLADIDADPGGWPEDATGDFDGELPPLARLLLAADPDAAAAMQRLGADFSFFDIDADDPASVRDAATLVEALRTLFDDLQEEGHGAIAYRLGQLSSEGTAPGAVADYVARLPIEFIDRLQATWLRGEPLPEPFDAVEDRRTGGGWSLDDRTYALRYRPTGHDDPLVRAWLDLIVGLPDEMADLREACLAEFIRPGAPGQCFTCHSLERIPNGVLAVNWVGRQRLDEPKSFTRFSHRPHLVQPELSDCTHCHRVDPSASAEPYAGVDPHRFQTEFQPLSKSACVTCHQPHAAGDHCTQCHHYHVSGESRVTSHE